MKTHMTGREKIKKMRAHTSWPFAPRAPVEPWGPGGPGGPTIPGGPWRPAIPWSGDRAAID